MTLMTQNPIRRWPVPHCSFRMAGKRPPPEYLRSGGLPKETEESSTGVGEVVIAAATTTVTGADILPAIEVVTGVVIGVAIIVAGIAVPPTATQREDV